MKAIINGKRYDTEKSIKIASWWNSYPTNDFKYCWEGLYQTKKGAYFLHGEGGAMSKYSEPCGNAVGWGSTIIPFTKKEAKDWLERTENYEALEANFEDSVEDA